MRREIRNALFSFLFVAALLIANTRLAFTPLDNSEITANLSDSKSLPNSSIESSLDIPPVLTLNEKLNLEVAEVFDIEKSAVILNYYGSKTWPAASLTKLMTALIAEENLKSDEPIAISDVEWLTDKTVLPNETFSSKDLIKAMMMTSSNRAAYSLETAFPEGIFTNLMNQKARDLGMENTNFTDSYGLVPDDKTTGDDLLKLVQYIWNNHRSILTIASQKELTIHELKTKEERRLISINDFSGEPDFLGGKTGYIAASKGNLISIFNFKNRPLLIIVLGAENRFEETSKILNFIKNASGSN